MRVFRTRRCGESDSATRNQENGRGWGGEYGGPLNGAARATTVEGGLGGCLDPTTTEPNGGSRAEQEEKTARRNTEHQLGHRRKHGGNQPAC
jgi:hypothetical protein